MIDQAFVEIENPFEEAQQSIERENLQAWREQQELNNQSNED